MVLMILHYAWPPWPWSSARLEIQCLVVRTIRTAPLSPYKRNGARYRHAAASEAYTAIAWGVGLSHERSDIAGAESFYSLEGDMCGTVMRGADALPGSKATSRAKGSHRKLGGLVSGRRCRMALTAYDGPHREGEEP
jgi:hypothetical protein